MAIGPLSFNESGLFECLVFIPCTGFAYAFSKTENSMSAPKRLLAIINPISGTKDKEEIPALIREVIDLRNIGWNVFLHSMRGMEPN